MATKRQWGSFLEAARGVMEVYTTTVLNADSMAQAAMAGNEAAYYCTLALANFLRALNRGRAPDCLFCGHKFSKTDPPIAVAFLVPIFEKSEAMGMGVCMGCGESLIQDHVLLTDRVVSQMVKLWPGLSIRPLAPTTDRMQ